MNHQSISQDYIARRAPAIFSTEPSDRVSERYNFVSTHTVLSALEREGWYPTKVSQSNARRENGQLFAKHSIRLRHSSNDTIANVGDIIPEVVLFNSHDTGSSFQLSAGLFRKVCANGLVLPDGAISEIRVRHDKYAPEKVVQGCFEIINEAPKAVARAQAMQSVKLSTSERLLLADTALKIRYDEGETLIRPEQLLRPRRHGDMSEDLWTTFNVIQENLLKGGVATNSTASNGRRLVTREVAAPGANIKLNKALWEMAEQFRTLKEAA